MKTRFIGRSSPPPCSPLRRGSHRLSTGDFATDFNALKQMREGRETFRFATFGDEAFWGDGIGLHLALAGANNGGVGPAFRLKRR